jgi:transcriptional regulator with XRE-family HTH domain
MTQPTTNPEWVRVGATIRTLRELRGVRPDELANALIISRSYLANIEAGRKRLSPELAARVANHLQVRQISILRPDEYPVEDAA